ncbi:hypothetical protein MRB53_001058 [Persea americana]|uniref:Uncharacterized protein n=1 Tax=Persea americana TaxID=3435 RepID=A0ACC2MRH7_PERAE|nr:hypothetical protein MRB53_001058 [Persea americana]
MRCGTLYHVYFTSKGRRLHSLFSSSRLSIGTPQSVISQNQVVYSVWLCGSVPPHTHTGRFSNPVEFTSCLIALESKCLHDK